MATTDPTALAADANCLNCIPPGLQLPVLIWLFAQIAGVTTDPTTLAANANCLACIPPGMQWPVLIWLATQMAGGTGGSASLQFTQTDQTLITNTMAETSILGPGIGSMTIPANTLKAGSVVTLEGFFVADCTTSSSSLVPRFRVKFNGAVVMDEGNSASALNVNPGVKAGFIMLMQMSATSTGHILGNISIESPGVSGACTVDTAPFAIPFTAPIAVEITMQASLSDSWIVTTQNLQMNILQPHP